MATIIEDTRNNQDKWAFLREELKAKGYNVVRSKLYVGDYTLIHNQTICIDTKKDLMEVAQDCFQDHDRFRTEMIRAKETGIKLYILVNSEYIFNIYGVKYFNVPTYKSTTYKTINGVKIVNHRRGEKMTKFNPETLQKTMITMQNKYGVEFIFCKKEQTPFKLLELLGEK